MVRLTRGLIVLFLFCFLLPPCWEQYGSSLQGVITDQTGTPINDAKVTGGQTDSSGFYRISGLPLGNTWCRQRPPALQPRSFPIQSGGRSRRSICLFSLVPHRPAALPQYLQRPRLYLGVSTTLAKFSICRTPVSWAKKQNW